MVASNFEYTITRPYPFRWFTPVVLLGGVILFALFTLLNLVTTGYSMETKFYDDVGTAMEKDVWFRNWPAYFSAKVKPSCQPATLVVESQINTNHKGLKYTITGVIETSEKNEPVQSPSLTYLNESLGFCEVTSISIDLEAAERSAAQFTERQWGSVARAFITCNLTASKNQTSFNLTAEYDFIPDNVASQGSFKFLRTDPVHSAALWWGESLLSSYWTWVSSIMEYIRNNNELDYFISPLRKGTVRLTPNMTQDIENLKFFDLKYSFLFENSTILWQQPNSNIANLETNATFPNIWKEIDGLGKSLYSVVLADLGQRTPTMLTNASSLQYFTSRFTYVIEHTPRGHVMPGPAQHSYVRNETDVPVDITPAFISAKYLCQVPSLNSVGSVIMTILLANLVLMGTSWTFVNFCAASWVRRSDPFANCCQKCMQSSDNKPPGVMLLDTLPGKTTKQRYSKVKSVDPFVVVGNEESLSGTLKERQSTATSDTGIRQTLQ